MNDFIIETERWDGGDWSDTYSCVVWSTLTGETVYQTNDCSSAGKARKDAADWVREQLLNASRPGERYCPDSRPEICNIKNGRCDVCGRPQ